MCSPQVSQFPQTRQPTSTSTTSVTPETHPSNRSRLSLRNSNSCPERMAQRRGLRGGLLAGFVVICLVKSAFALDPNRTISQYVLDKWGPDRGFVGGAIYAISQSSDGYLWIGTERGLVRFDGDNFKMIQQPLPDAAP